MPIVTPSYEPSQGYVGPAPEGIDAPAAWRRGVRGAGVWFADVEGNWNAKHEDLPTERISLVAGTPFSPELATPEALQKSVLGLRGDWR